MGVGKTTFYLQIVISQKRCEIEGWLQWTINIRTESSTSSHVIYGVTWPKGQDVVELRGNPRGLAA